jgi:hypothetical protein
MIIKHLSRKSHSGQLINYILKYINNAEKVKGKSCIIKHNITSNAIAGYINEFKANEKRRIHTRSNQPTIQHVILSWSNKSSVVINDAIIQDLAKQYIKFRGDNNLYLGTIHKDREHIHLHMAVSATQLNGVSSRISKEQFKDLKLAMDAYQQEQYPQLCDSLPEHGKSKHTIPYRYNNRISQKELLLQSIQTAYEKATSLDAFIATIKAAGHEPYFRNNQLTGVKYQGEQKFRLSALGFDKEKIQNLAYLNNKEEQELVHLHNLRNKNQYLTKETPPAKNSINEEKELQEILTLRHPSHKEQEFSFEKNDNERMNGYEL